MTCHCCSGPTKKFGRFKNRNRIVQRYRCTRCEKTFSDTQPLEGLRIETEKVIQCVHLLCEGVGIRAAERLTGLSRETVLNILEVAGQKCASTLSEKIQNVKAEHVQVDEIHCFVNSKAQNTEKGNTERGDFFTYLSIDRASKLIINWRTSKRDGENTLAFMQDLQRRVPERFSLTTDAFAGYCVGNGAVKQVFGNEIDYATEVKVYGRLLTGDYSRWRNPLKVIGIRRQARIGQPDLTMSTTCHAERTNLSVRLFTRRFTRCTLGYSKKLENLRHAVAMFVAHFNFCRVHSAHKLTPAVAAGITDHTWTIKELIQLA